MMPDISAQVELKTGVDALYVTRPQKERFTDVEKVQGKIWALRVKHSSDYYRIFYFADSDQEFVLFHAIKKKADKFTKQDIKIAMKRMNEHLAGISRKNC